MTVLEHALPPVRPGQEQAFESAFRAARPVIGASRGCRRLSLFRCLERPSTHLVLVEWDRLADHTEGFRGSPAHQRWRELLHHFHDPFPTVEHVTEV